MTREELNLLEKLIDKKISKALLAGHHNMEISRYYETDIQNIMDQIAPQEEPNINSEEN